MNMSPLSDGAASLVGAAVLLHPACGGGIGEGAGRRLSWLPGLRSSSSSSRSALGWKAANSCVEIANRFSNSAPCGICAAPPAQKSMWMSTTTGPPSDTCRCTESGGWARRRLIRLTPCTSSPRPTARAADRRKMVPAAGEAWPLTMCATSSSGDAMMPSTSSARTLLSPSPQADTLVVETGATQPPRASRAEPEARHTQRR
mmetsp:Transcript_17522/g.52952  ORF Transcript_17522/g.52952 Transcript_17522/m.52952 type:complete len:202 (+) Transcript_17522:489-1094(+)